MIEGLCIVDLQVRGDERGWFKETWRRTSGFVPVQHNLSFNAKRGTTRGMHAEPWDKLITVAHGKVFGAWIDLREGSATYGEQFTATLTPAQAVFVPRGVANGYQALSDNAVYSYLVTDYYSPTAQYVGVSYKNIEWPLEPTAVSAKDEALPMEARKPMVAKKIAVIGRSGQVARVLRSVLGERAEFFSSQEWDLGGTQWPERPWRQYSAIINAGAYTAVDEAEGAGRERAWAVNASGPARLAALAVEHDLTLVQISSDYVFDGQASAYDEDAPLSPISVYGATKAAADLAVSVVPKHYIVRTAWVVGEGTNFVTTMEKLAREGAEPKVVADQVGRITHADDVARAIVYLLDTQAPYGTYNVTGSGEPMSWYEVAREVFVSQGRDPAAVTPISSGEYGAAASRPSQSVLKLDKIEATGWR